MPTCWKKFLLKAEVAGISQKLEKLLPRRLNKLVRDQVGLPQDVAGEEAGAEVRCGKG